MDEVFRSDIDRCRFDRLLRSTERRAKTTDARRGPETGDTSRRNACTSDPSGSAGRRPGADASRDARRHAV